MKVLAIFVVIVVVADLAVGSKELEEMATVIRNCLAKGKVTDEEFKKFSEHNLKPEEVSQELKCFIKCTMAEVKHLKDGVLDVDAAMKTWTNIPEYKNKLDVYKKAYPICKSEKGKDDCDTAYKISTCLGKYMDT